MTRRKDNPRRILSHEVGDMVCEMGRLTLDDLELLFPDYSRYQLQNALSAESRRGTVVFLQRLGVNGTQGVWGPAAGKRKVERPLVQRAIPSVFHLASGPVLVPPWGQPVREHFMQGEW